MVVDTSSEAKLSHSTILLESKAKSGNYNGSKNQSLDDGESSGGEEIANVHRLVQDENAKTILLNVPLDEEPTTPSKSGMSQHSSIITTKPPKRPLASPRPGSVLSSSSTNCDSSRRKLSTKSLPSTSSARQRSASVGRDKHLDTQARYWAFLFENLRRAVDDLYRTCESDECIPAVKEVILVFENYVRDFQNLANWLKLNREYENTPPPQRPTSLAWEVRKTPPASCQGKLTPTSVLLAHRLFMATPAKRALDFESKKDDHKKGNVSEIIKEIEVTPVEEKKDKEDSSSEQKASLETPSMEESKVVEVPIEEHEPQREEKDVISVESSKSVKPKQEPSSIEENASSQNSAAKSNSPKSSRPLSANPIASLQTFPKLKDANSTGTKVTIPKGQGTRPSSASVSSNPLKTVPSAPRTAWSAAASRNLKPSSTTTLPASVGLAKAKSVSSSNLLSNSTGKSGKQWGDQQNKQPDARTNRVSLVARQGRPSTATTVGSKSVMVRSATASALPNRACRVVAFGRGVVLNSMPQKVGAQNRNDTARQNVSSSNHTSSGQYSGQNEQDGKKSQTIPFGSSSSLSSSGSNRSWADTVRGVANGPRSVDDLSSVKPSVGLAEDDIGWETVKPRQRSKFSPSNSLRQKKHDGENRQRFLRVQCNPRSRFNVPSSAVSLPSIALISNMAEDESYDSLKNGEKGHKKLKPVKSASGLLRRDRPNLERISGSDTGSSESSAEDLHRVRTPTNKGRGKRSSGTPRAQEPLDKKKDQCKGKEKVKSEPEENLSLKKTRRSSAPVEDEIRAAFVVSPSPSNSQEDDDGCESSDVMDSEIAKRDVAIALAEEEERSLAREIQETEKSEMPDVDTDGDQVSASEDGDPDRRSPAPSGGYGTPQKPFATLLEGFSWADEIDLEDQLQESRYPGRAIQIHEKLSSPARKREPHETFKHHQEKQKNAKIRREKFQEEKAQKLLGLNARIQEVIAQKMFLINEKRDMMNSKMARAEAKRQEHIDGIRKKAREEDAKLKEIAFINELQAQNARFDALAQNQTSDVKVEERLAELAEERQKKQEQREAKEARAEERRKAMEEERIKNVEALKNRIKSRDERIQEEQELARRGREEAAREKARDREEKLSTVRAAERDMKEELQEKINQKHQEASRRHKEKLEHIRQKAFELSVQRCDDEAVPKLKPYDPKKKCSLCSVLIVNEVHLQSHIRGRVHAERVCQFHDGRKLTREELQSCNIKHIHDAPADERDPKTLESKERLKAMKKKAKKLKSRMLARAVDYESNLTNISSAKCDAPNRAKIGKSLRDIEKVFGSQGKGAWPNNAVSAVERALGEIIRTFEKGHSQDKAAFYALEGFGMLSKLFNMLAEQRQSCVIPLKSIALCCRVWILACTGHRQNTEYVLCNNLLTALVDILLDRLIILTPESQVDDLGVPAPQEPQVDPVAKAIMALLAQGLEDLRLYLKDDQKPVDKTRPADITIRAQDQVSYIVTVGIVDKLASYFHSVHDPIEGEPEVGEFLMSALHLVSALTGIAEALTDPMADPTHLWSALKVTDLAGTVSMLYGMLLHQGASPREKENPPEKLPDHTLAVANASLQLLHRMVRQKLTMVQEVLSQECISLEFRHIASYLLWYCQAHNKTDLLHLTIVLVGYFAARNLDNQIIVQSGHQPSVLQQLCNLPFVYFSQPDLKRVLFPTLLACCHNNDENTGILTEEMNWQLIQDFLNTHDGKQHLVELVLSN